MIRTIEDLKIIYEDYSDIHGKIKREINTGTYIPITRGLYETNKSTPSYYLSSYIYGPSYLSFDYALSYYGMIPERVNTYTSATYNKQKTKRYITPFGTFIYRDFCCEGKYIKSIYGRLKSITNMMCESTENPFVGSSILP